MNRFLRPLVYLLLLLLPLQAVAAANMLVCNSMMHLRHAQVLTQMQPAQQTHTMPCHAHVKPASPADMTANSNPSQSHTSSCKHNCDAVCASLCVIAALTPNAKTLMLPTTLALAGMAHAPYVSITLPGLQRPPIFLS